MASGYLETPDALIEVAKAISWDQILPLIHEATDLAAKWFEEDGFNSMQLFGNASADTLASRLLDAAKSRKIGLQPRETSGKWAYLYEDYIIHFHRVNKRTLVPITGDTVKREAREVVSLGPRLFDDEPPVGKHLVVGIVSNPEFGVQRVVLLEVVKVQGKGSWGYAYAPIDIFSEFGGDFGDGVAGPPPEDVTPPVITRTPRSPKTGTEND